MAAIKILPSLHVRGKAVRPLLASCVKEPNAKVTMLCRSWISTVNHLRARSRRIESAVCSICVRPIMMSASIETEFTSPKTGAVGEDRFRESAVPGTYWSAETSHYGATLSVSFHSSSEDIVESARAGENLLRVAERCGVLTPNADFCFEGTCCHCEMDVKGGAKEVGYRADASAGTVVRSCICPVPSQDSMVEVTILSEDDAWGEGVL